MTWGVAGGGGQAGKVGSPAGARLASVPADAILGLGGVAGDSEAWRTVEHSSIQNDAAQATCRRCRSSAGCSELELEFELLSCECTFASHMLNYYLG